MTSHLTPERLREYLFSQTAWPHWDYRLDRLLFGVEVEYFVAQKGNRNQLFKKANFESFLQRMERFGYSCKNTESNPWCFVKEKQVGYIAIKPDFAFHILEIALPPRSDLMVLTNLLKDVLQEVDVCLAELDFERCHESFLLVDPADFDLVEMPRLEGHLDCLQHKSSQGEFADRHFPAFLAATHVHLNVSSEKDLCLMPILYELEWLALTLLDRTHYRTNSVRSLRTLYYRDSFGHDYRLVGVPKQIPASLEEYVEQYNASPKLFPNDHFFPVRDFSLIRPRNFGSFEFRSGCSPRQVDDLQSIIAFRAVQWLYAIKYADKPVDPSGTEQHCAVIRYVDAKLGGGMSYENAVLERLERILPETGEYGEIIRKLLFS